MEAQQQQQQLTAAAIYHFLKHSKHSSIAAKREGERNRGRKGIRGPWLSQLIMAMMDLMLEREGEGQEVEDETEGMRLLFFIYFVGGYG